MTLRWRTGLRFIREKGTNRSRFFRGQVDKYTWVDLGSSYLPSDLLAAFLYGQLQARTEIQSRRRAVWNLYYEELADWASRNDIGLPHVPTHCAQAYHLFYLLTRSLEQRQALINHLRDDGIQSVFHYLPLHLSSMGRSFGGDESRCPVTENVSDRLLRLPFYTTLDRTTQQRVIASILAFDTR